MPNIKSAKKRVLVAEKKALQNKVVKTGLKTALKKAEGWHVPYSGGVVVDLRAAAAPRASPASRLNW